MRSDVGNFDSYRRRHFLLRDGHKLGDPAFRRTHWRQACSLGRSEDLAQRGLLGDGFHLDFDHEYRDLFAVWSSALGLRALWKGHNAARNRGRKEHRCSVSTCARAPGIV